MKKILLLSLMTLCSQFAFANGYQVLLQGNKEVAMGNAGVAVKPTASAIFFNPGALGFLDKTEIQVGGSMVFGRTNFVETGSFDEYEARPVIPAGYLYFAFSKDSASRLKAGLAVTTPFGSLVEYEDDWVGQDKVQRLFLANINIQPTLSYRISDKLSIGAGLGINIGEVELERRSDLNLNNTDRTITNFVGKSSPTYNFNVGIYYQPTKDFSIGVSYRSASEAKVEDGDVTFDFEDGLSGTVKSLFGAGPTAESASTKFDASIPLPSAFTIGIAAYPTDRLTMAFDVAFVGWSDYEALTFDYEDAIPNDQAPGTTTNQTSFARNFQNSTVIHLGLEYMITDKLAGRAGFYYDETPVLSGFMTPETPDSPAKGYTAGLGYDVSDKFALDVSFLFLDKAERKNEVPVGVNTNGLSGTYKTNALIPGIGVRYRW
jgi:long-chain fatty acid transport protein